MLCEKCKNVGYVEGCKIHRGNICMTYPPHCRNCGELIMIEIKEPPRISVNSKQIKERLLAVAHSVTKADYKVIDKKRVCAKCGAELYWEGHPFLCAWKCPSGCKDPVNSVEFYEISKRDFENILG